MMMRFYSSPARLGNLTKSLSCKRITEKKGGRMLGGVNMEETILS